MYDSPPEEYQPIRFRAMIDGTLEDITLMPLASDDDNGIPSRHELYIDNIKKGVITCKEDRTCSGIEDDKLLAEIGEMLREHYG
jgi:hypothetical protein